MDALTETLQNFFELQSNAQTTKALKHQLFYYIDKRMLTLSSLPNDAFFFAHLFFNRLESASFCGVGCTRWWVTTSLWASKAMEGWLWIWTSLIHLSVWWMAYVPIILHLVPSYITHKIVFRFHYNNEELLQIC